MNQYVIANKIKDLSRSIYIQCLAGKASDNNQILFDIQEIESELNALRACIALEQSGYYMPKSDLKGLAAREAQ